MPNKYIHAKDGLIKEVRAKFGKPLNSVKSFEELGEITRLSSQTLRRFFGKIDKEKKVSVSTLSLICNFLGYKDWNHYLEKFEELNKISLEDKLFIENMECFFRSGASYNDEYQQKTMITDTMNDYAKVIYKSKGTILYFYEFYKNNNWATNYVFAWLPNYNYFGQDWFREILEDRIQQTNVPSTKLALCNFLIFGDFLTNGNVNKTLIFNDLHQYYQEYKSNSSYSPYHEMRYHSILLIEAKSNADQQKFEDILENYLDDLNAAGLSEFHYHEMIIAFCNTLLWLQENELAYHLLEPLKNFIATYDQSCKKQSPVHFLGINMAFVKTTFALTWVTNQLEFPLDIKPKEFKDTASLLYNDYIRIQYLATCIISAKTTLKKKLIFKDLQELVLKTGYVKVYDILSGTDPMFQNCSA